MIQITSKSPCVRGGAAAGGETLLSDVCCLVFVISFISLRWGGEEGGLLKGLFTHRHGPSLEGSSGVIAWDHEV